MEQTDDVTEVRCRECKRVRPREEFLTAKGRVARTCAACRARATERMALRASKVDEFFADVPTDKVVTAPVLKFPARVLPAEAKPVLLSAAGKTETFAYDAAGEAIFISFEDGKFEKAVFGFKFPYSREQWRILAAVEAEISRLENTLNNNDYIKGIEL